MKKQAKDVKKGDKIKIAGKEFVVKEVEISDIGKQGKRKIRIEASGEEKIVIVRPEDYPIESE